MASISQAVRQGNPAELYLAGLGSQNSVRTVRSNLNRIARHLFGADADLQSAPWQNLTRTIVLGVMDVLRQEGLSAATINLNLSNLKGVAHEAWIEGVLSQMDYLQIRDIKGLKNFRLQSGRSLTHEESLRLLRKSEKADPVSVRNRAMMAVMLCCGLRRFEVAALTMAGYSKASESLTFVGKGNKERKVFLPPLARPVMEEWLRARGEKVGALFPSCRRVRDGGSVLVLERHLSGDSVYRIVKSRARELGFVGITPHDLRRTFATQALSSGVDLFTLQRAMGHANPNTTSRYDHRHEKALRAAAEQIRF